MLGVILCGGQSIRMGTDKGLLKSKTKTWAEAAADKIKKLKLPVVLSVSSKQYVDYSSIFLPDQLITDNDALKFKGPLCGVLSVHLQYPNENLLILGCDMPLITTELLKELISKYEQHANTTAFVYTNDDEPEPLCALYKAEGLKHIIHLYQSHQLIKHSMKFMLDHLRVYPIAIPDKKKKYFKNINAHAGLNGL